MSKEILLIEHVASWLAKYMEESGRKVFIVNYNGARSDALVLKVCSEATSIKKGLSTICLYQDFFPKEFMGRSYKIDIPVIPNITGTEYMIANKWADDKDGVVIGSVDKTFGKYKRTYTKIEYSLCDIFPLYDLYYSEIIHLTDFIWPDAKWRDAEVDDYKMLEFCVRAENSFGIITSTNPPHKHEMWHTFTGTQKKFVAECQQREKKTRHKELRKPYPKIPDNIGLYNGR